MAVDLPLVIAQQTFALKAETTTGTLESLTAAEAVTNFLETDVEYDNEFKQRAGQSSASPLPGVPGASMANIKAKVELYGNGTSGLPAWATLLKASGMAVSTGQTLVPLTGGASATSASVARYVDGRCKPAAGCMFTWTMTGEAGKPVEVQFDGKGVYQPPTATSILVPTYDSVIPPTFMGATFTIGGTSYKIPKFELAMNNNVAMRRNGLSAYGYFSAVITGARIPTFKISPDALPIGTKDWYALFLAGTTAALNIVIGTVANNIVTIAAPALQLTKPPQDEDREGYLADSLEFQCVRSASTGDDELSLAFS